MWVFIFFCACSRIIQFNSMFFFYHGRVWLIFEKKNMANYIWYIVFVPACMYFINCKSIIHGAYNRDTSVIFVLSYFVSPPFVLEFWATLVFF